jgi:hypothetical protein
VRLLARGHCRRVAPAPGRVRAPADRDQEAGTAVEAAPAARARGPRGDRRRFFAFRPDPCQGTNFESDNFGYCLVVPDGWEAGPAQFGADVTLDQFAPPTGSATVVVEAVDLETGTELEQWSDFVRQRDEDAGLTPGPASESDLDGTDALQWDVSVASEGGDTFLMREVVTVKGDVGWRVTLNDLQDGFDTSAVVFNDMLESWEFS